MHSRFKNFFKWLNLFIIIATLLAGLAPYASPRYGWWVSVFGMAFPWLLLFNIFFILFWLITKNIYFLFSLACILTTWYAVTGIIGFNRSDPGLASSLRVMSFNCRAFYDFTQDKSTKTKVLQVINDYPVEVICFQEFPMNPKSARAIIEDIKNSTQLKYFFQPEQYALAIFSKYPISKTAILDTDNVASGCIYADLDHPDGKVRLYNVHLKSNRVSDDANKVLEERELRKKSTWVGIKKMMGKINTASKIRAEQALRISDHIKTCNHPVILCGDFNETPQSYTYRLLSNQLKDSFREKGFGIGSTYAGKIPGLRIDYILASKNIQINDHQILRKEVSDHYPIISSLTFGK